MKVVKVAVAAAIALATASAAQAGVIIQPKAVTIQVGGELAGSAAVNMINQSGLSKKYVSGTTDFETYLASSPIHSIAAGGEWLGVGPAATAQVIFDLGEVVEFTGFALWNEDATSLGNIIMSSWNGQQFSSYAGVAPAANPVGQDYGATLFRHQKISARYVRFDLYGCNQANFAHNACGIGEVAFNSTQLAPQPGAVPEPATWAMMIIGFGGAGAALRSRRRAGAPAAA